MFALFAAAIPSRAADARAPEAFLRLGPLVERIARLNAQSGQGVMPQRSRKALAETVRDFDATLRAALAAAPGAEARENYVLLSMLWHDYREWALKAPTRETARKLRERTEEVAWVAAKGVKMVNDSPRAAIAAPALRAAQAANASQRIAKAYLWRHWDIRDDGIARELREARENLPRALDALASTPGLAPELVAHVESAQTQWRFLSDAATQLDASPGNARSLDFACKAADHIFDSMDRVIRQSATQSSTQSSTQR